MSRSITKLVLVLAIFLLPTQVSMEADTTMDSILKVIKMLSPAIEVSTSEIPPLKRILCIYNLVRFKKN